MDNKYIFNMKDKNNNTPDKEIKQNKIIRVQSKEHQRKNSNTLMIPINKIAGTQDLRKQIQGSEAKSEYEGEDYMGVNQILVYRYKRHPPTYYVPCYLRMRVNKVQEINYIESKASIDTDIRLWFMIKDFPEAVQNQIINQASILINSANKIQLENIIQPVKLDHGFIKNKSKNVQGFLISEELQLDIQSNPFMSPFQLVKLIANLEIRKITLGEGNPQFQQLLNEEDKHFVGSSVEFNFLDAHPFLQFNFGYVRNLGSFDIAESLVDMKWTNNGAADDDDEESLKQQGQQDPLVLIGKATGLDKTVKTQKIKSGDLTPDAFQHGQIVIPLYKYPSTTIINVFVPLYVVGLMNLGVFFELNDMSNRDGALATFLLAYIAFFPTIRQNLPQTPKIVMIQILVYIQIVCSLICFFYSLVVNQIEDYAFVWNQDVPFLVCISLTAANIAVVLGIFIIHKAVWQRGYNKLPKGSTKYLDIKFLNTDDNEQWWNKQCDQEFEDFISLGLVKPYKSKKIKRKPKKSLGFLDMLIDDPDSKEKTNLNATNVNLLEVPKS